MLFFSQTMEALQLLSLWLAIVLFATETIVQAKDAEDGKRNGKLCKNIRFVLGLNVRQFAMQFF